MWHDSGVHLRGSRGMMTAADEVETRSAPQQRRWCSFGMRHGADGPVGMAGYARVYTLLSEQRGTRRMSMLASIGSWPHTNIFSYLVLISLRTSTAVIGVTCGTHARASVSLAHNLAFYLCRCEVEGVAPRITLSTQTYAKLMAWLTGSRSHMGTEKNIAWPGTQIAHALAQSSQKLAV